MMIQINIWLSPRINSFRYKGKRYILNSQYYKLKKIVESIRYTLTVIMVILLYFCVNRENVVYVSSGIILLIYFGALFVYIVKFPNKLEELI